MGNNNVKHNHNNFNQRPHSVLGLRSDERLLSFGEQRLKNRKCFDNNKLKACKAQGKALLPPLPRSHSFHQILRPTENGVNLIQKGTIRGIDNNSNKNHAKEQVFSRESLNDELNAILRARRCRSEADLLEEDEDDNEEGEEHEREEDQSDQCSSQSSGTPKSGLDRSDFARKGLTNGVAAKIQRSKYQKGPAPPPPIISANLDNCKNAFQSVNCSHQFSQLQQQQQNGHLMDKMTCLESSKMLLPGSRNGANHHRIEMPIKEFKQADLRQKVGLIRRLSEKSHLSNKVSDYEQSEDDHQHQHQHQQQRQQDVEEEGSSLFKDNFMMIPRLRCNNNHFEFGLKHHDNEASTNGIKSILNGLNSHTNGHPNHNRNHRQTSLLNELSLNEMNELISRESVVRNKQAEKNFSLQVLNNRVPEMHKIISEKKDKLCEKSKTRLNSKQFFFDDRSKSNRNSNKSNLASAFDDNFILKRSTPTAGLFPPDKSLDMIYTNHANKKRNDIDLYPKRISELHELDLKNLSSSNLPSSGRFLSKNFNLNSSNQWTGQESSNSPPLASFNINNNSLASLNSLFTDDYNCRGKKFDPLKESPFCRSTSLRQLNHSSISDSANFSDEEDHGEDEIKVVLKPFLPPPKRMAFEERIIIDDDLFNCGDDVSAIKYGRQKCWTPMQDLTSTDDEDDDGINCDVLSEDEDIHGKRDIRDLIQNYDTRFTLKNQLRTLIQNSKPRLPYSSS